MKRAVLLLAVALGCVTNVEASTTTIHATPAAGTVGQAVTFAAAFTSSCPGTVTTHYFTIDGKQVNGTLTQSGRSGTETLSTTTLAAGTHAVTYYWQIKGTICRGTASMSYAVTAAPSPSPSPSPTPSPSASPSSTPSSAHPDSGDASSGSDATLGYLGAGLIVIVIVAGVGLAVLGRR